MTPKLIVDHLLDVYVFEASVRRPPRGTRWIAVFTGPVPGQQIWRSTGMRDRAAALALAKKWEAQARQQRAASRRVPTKPSVRVRRGSGEAAAGLLNQKQVGAIMGLSVRTVRDIERRAFGKLRRHPALRQFWREHVTGGVEEAVASPDLDGAEIAALFNLTRTALEQQALTKLLAMMLADRLLAI
ncbi:MAG: sigma factor-like helix-turn-helix DNA-binding protein [Limisphaerales bacterium]